MSEFNISASLDELVQLADQKAASQASAKGEFYSQAKAILKLANKFSDNADDYATARGVTTNEVFAFSDELKAWSHAISPEVTAWQNSDTTQALLSGLTSLSNIPGLMSEEDKARLATASAILKRSGTRAPSKPAETVEGRPASRVYITDEQGKVLADMAGNTKQAHLNLGGRICDLVGVERSGDAYKAFKDLALQACTTGQDVEIKRHGEPSYWILPQVDDIDAEEIDEDDE